MASDFFHFNFIDFLGDLNVIKTIFQAEHQIRLKSLDCTANPEYVQLNLCRIRIVKRGVTRLYGNFTLLKYVKSAWVFVNLIDRNFTNSLIALSGEIHAFQEVWSAIQSG